MGKSLVIKGADFSGSSIFSQSFNFSIEADTSEYLWQYHTVDVTQFSKVAIIAEPLTNIVKFGQGASFINAVLYPDETYDLTKSYTLNFVPTEEPYTKIDGLYDLTSHSQKLLRIGFRAMSGTMKFEVKGIL